MAIATFGAGCFWGVEETYRQIDGVLETAVGYMGGTTDNPTYREVCTGRTNHAEVVKVSYDPEKVSYDTLVDIFFDNHNPTELNRQGPDVGTQYRSVVFTHDENQAAIADKKRSALQASGRFKRDIVTLIEPAKTFWIAEDYHQQYLAKRGLVSCHV